RPWRIAASSTASWNRSGSATFAVAPPASRAVTIVGISRQLVMRYSATAPDDRTGACGPGGQRAAIQAAKLGRRVAVVDRRETLGGVCTNTGTIPSKTLREAVVFLA